jgi:hypothetical protein
MNNRVVDVLRDFIPRLEFYTSDESFLSLEGLSGISRGDLVAIWPPNPVADSPVGGAAGLRRHWLHQNPG